MSNKPIFCATHPRACSTAFERVFMTRRDTIQCVHEPFGDAFYYGPERLSERYEKDEKARIESGFSQSTFKTIIDRIEREKAKGKRIFIKDITHYLVPPDKKPPSIAPSLLEYKSSEGTIANSSLSASTKITNEQNGTAPFPYHTAAEPGNPSVIPRHLLSRFHFTFLIRHPRSSIPSYWRCTVPPLDEVTGFHYFLPSEAGYDEVRRLFDYLKDIGEIGPARAGGSDPKQQANGEAEGKKMTGVEICVVDADDLLNNPSGIVQAYCKTVGIEYTPEMLKWGTDEDHRIAKEAFDKWRGFHEEAIESSELKAQEPKTDDQLYAEWMEKYGAEAAEVIKKTVAVNVADYEYLKQFAIKV